MLHEIPILEDVDSRKLAYAESAGARQVYLETYGCQMNVSDSEIVAAVLRESGYGLTRDAKRADVILLNTCAIRENAEQKVRHRLDHFRAQKRKTRGTLKIGVLGCMAERLRHKLLEQEKLVDLVAGPDAYRDLPRLLQETRDTGQAAINVQLSREETYADIAPVRVDSNGVTAFVSIMRGCNNMCAFCVVPFTRGRERSRPVDTIVDECRQLIDQGYREVTLLGQNVNSYRDGDVSFAELLYRVSMLTPQLRIRYSTSHPKDCTDELLQVHRERTNVCDYIHLPVQHGNTGVLQRMRRGYTAAQYLRLVERARTLCPGVSLSTDIITGFCGETDAEHADTLALLKAVRYDHAYMFMYSERPDTYAARKYADDVPTKVKKRRLSEVIQLQSRIALENNQAEIGRTHTVLIEGYSRRSTARLRGRTDTNKMVVFDRQDYVKGQYVDVRITGCTSATLMGRVAYAP